MLSLYSWNGARWESVLPCANCGLDTVANMLTVEWNHLTDFALGLDQGPSLPVTVTLMPVADAYILSSTPTINYGTSQTLYAGRQTNGAIGRALLRFDLSGIPAGATVQSASFQAFLLQSSPTPATLPIELRRIDTAWQESTVAGATPHAGPVVAAADEVMCRHRLLQGAQRLEILDVNNPGPFLNG